MITTNPTPDQLATYMASQGPARHKISEEIRNGHYPVVPESVLQLIAAEDAIDREAVQFDGVPTSYVDFLRERTDALLAGASADSITKDALALFEDTERRRIGQMTIGHLRNNLQKRWKDTLAANADEMLAGLRADLEALVHELQAAAAALAGLDVTDSNAVAGGNSEQLAAVRTLNDRQSPYRRLRQLQRALVESVSAPPGMANTWLGVWKTGFGDFAEGGDPAADLPPALWFSPIVEREDLWLPCLQDLRDAYAGNRRPAPEPEPEGVSR